MDNIPPVRKNRPLTRKQLAFAKEIIGGASQTQAALATYNTADYATAAQIGHENIKKPEVSDHILSHSEWVKKTVRDSLERHAAIDAAITSAKRDIVECSEPKDRNAARLCLAEFAKIGYSQPNVTDKRQQTVQLNLPNRT